MSTEAKWRCVWGAWVVFFVAAETYAIRSKLPEAPLSHHLRTSTHRVAHTRSGRIALWLAADKLHRHLYPRERTRGTDWPR